MKTDVRNVEPLWKGTKKVLCCVAVDGAGILPKAVGTLCGTTLSLLRIPSIPINQNGQKKVVILQSSIVNGLL